MYPDDLVFKELKLIKACVSVCVSNNAKTNLIFVEITESNNEGMLILSQTPAQI